MNNLNGLPPQKLSWKKKTKDWRKKHIDWAEKHIWSYDSSVRKPLRNKIINYNLLNGILDLEDFALILNPHSQEASFIPDKVQHYPIINSKINILVGEESSRRFDYRLIVTNPEEISEIENNKKASLIQDLSAWATSTSENEEEAMRDLEKIEKYHKYEWQDLREIRGNALLKHYKAELNIASKFNQGFQNAMWSGEEVYQMDIVGGEPTFDVVNPNKMIVLRSGYSDRIEDADMIVLWDYWSPGRITDTYYDVLTDSDVKYIDSLVYNGDSDGMGNLDPTEGFTFTDVNGPDGGLGVLTRGGMFDTDTFFGESLTDGYGNIRIVRVFWKSFRKILKVKSYNFETGEEEFNFYPETYIPNTAMGEESSPLWINEAWEATKIGKIYVNMRPRIVQYNRLSNPSRCHFGIIGSIYSLNEGRPFSLVDMAKPYNYLYNVIHDRLNKNLAANWGKITKLNLAEIPTGWEIDKWMYYAKVNKLAVVDSFKEGNKGASTGKLAGMMSPQSPVIDADQGNSIQNDINLLQFVKAEMGEAMGITPQREGQITNRETVGGVERSVLQSSHITEWLFTRHDDVRKRALEAFLETAKVALRGKSKKFEYILSDGSTKIIDIDGDEFAECDYGLVIDNSNQTETFLQKLESLAQALVQNQMISTKSLFKLWDGSSISEITRSVEEDERVVREQSAQEAEANREQFQQDLETRMMIEQEKLRINEESNVRDNETKIIIEEMKQLYNSANSETQDPDFIDPSKKADLEMKIKMHNDNLKLKRETLVNERKQQGIDNKFKQQEIDIKRKVANKPVGTNTKK